MSGTGLAGRPPGRAGVAGRPAPIRPPLRADLRSLHRWGGSPDLRRRLVFGALVGVLASVPLTLLALSIRTNWSPLRRLDHWLVDALYRVVVDRPLVVDLLDVAAVVFHPWVFRVAVLALVVLLVRRGARRLAWWACITMATGSLLGVLLKVLIARARPDLEAPVGTAPGYSFPSGHALNSAVGVLILLLVLAPVLARTGAKASAWAAGAAVVLLTGLDRLALGVHYLSDVIAGWIVAVALVTATAVAFETWRRDLGRPPSTPLDGVDPEASRGLG